MAVLGREAINPPIGQATSFAALENECSALAIGHSAGVIAKGELAGMAATVGFAHRVIGADHARLNCRKSIHKNAGL